MPFQSGRYYIIARFLSVPASMIIFILYKKYHEVFFFRNNFIFGLNEALFDLKNIKNMTFLSISEISPDEVVKVDGYIKQSFLTQLHWTIVSII